MTQGRGHSSSDCLFLALRVALGGRTVGSAFLFLVFLSSLYDSSRSSTSIASSIILIDYNRTQPARNYFMTQISKKRLHFTRALQRRERQQQFHIRRMALLTQPSIDSSLQEWVKLSLDKNRLLSSQQKRTNVIDRLVMISQSSEMGQLYQGVIAICSNVLIDDLSLDEKAAFTLLLQKSYEFIKLSVKMEEASWNIAYSLPSFIAALPSLHEQQSFQCMVLALELITKLITSISTSNSYDDNKWQSISSYLIQSLQYLIFCQPEEHYQLPIRISSNLTHLQNLLRSHYYLIQQHTNTALVIREGFLRVFQYVTKEVELCDFPWLFQSDFFVGFIMDEIKSKKPKGVKSQFDKMALNILTNLFIDFGKGDCEVIITHIIKIDPNFRQILLTQCLSYDQTIFLRLKLIKTILSIQQLYEYFQQQIQKHWKDIVDQCCSSLRQQKIQCYRLSIQTLLILVHLYCDSNQINIPNYMQNIGCESLFDYLQNKPMISKELQEEMEQISAGIDEIKSFFAHPN